MDELLREAHWSDEFFNYIPAVQATGDYYTTEIADSLDECLRPVAKQFIEANTDCPYNENWLVADYIRRI